MGWVQVTRPYGPGQSPRDPKLCAGHTSPTRLEARAFLRAASDPRARG